MRISWGSNCVKRKPQRLPSLPFSRNLLAGMPLGFGGKLGLTMLHAVMRNLLGSAAIVFGLAAPSLGQTPHFERALADAVSQDAALSAFYHDRNEQDLWTGTDDGARLQSLMRALSGAGDHGLPVGRYDVTALQTMASQMTTEGDRGRMEAELSRAYVAYAQDVSVGAVDPGIADTTIYRTTNRPDPATLLVAVAASADPARHMRSLSRPGQAYVRIMKESLHLIAAGSTGPVATKVNPGDRGDKVIALRNALAVRGYLGHQALAEYDGRMKRAVQRFQRASGLNADGLVTDSTLALLNEGREGRLAALTVAMERLRWMGMQPQSGRRVWVNQPEFLARIVDDGRITFQTRAVIGKDVPDQRSPEFSDEIEHMVINPSWGVPRSITVKEYLPLLQKNPNAVSHLQVVDKSGRVVSRGAVNFAGYSAKSFPFSLRQPPSDGNALGIVKFMFPNEHNIYLHDTPSKNLFANEMRAYSHGCIRLGDPVDFAHALLALQTDDPRALFQSKLETGQESLVKLDQPVPVHLVYFTAWPGETGVIHYFGDVYGRDARILDALIKAGMAPIGEQG
jgi:murein L,D-transpeptidase YcbB/YkuD